MAPHGTKLLPAKFRLQTGHCECSQVDTLPILLPAVDPVGTHSTSLPMLRTWWQGQSTEHLSISALLELDGGWTGIQERDKEAVRSP